MILITHDQPPELLQPRDTPLDLPAVRIPSPLRCRERFLDLAVVPGRTDQPNAAASQSLPQRIAVRRLVVQQPHTPGPAAPRDHRPIDERNHLGRFVPVRTGKMHPQRQIVTVGQHVQVGPFSLTADSNLSSPFFARENDPSAKSTRQSICPRSSDRHRSRLQAASQTPLRVQSRKRLQQVGYEGKSFGKSFQRAPLRRTHRIPSRQGREGTLGRPPLRVISRSGNRSAIKSHWESVSCVGRIVRSVVDAGLRRHRLGHQVSVSTMMRASFHLTQHATPKPIRSLTCRI